MPTRPRKYTGAAPADVRAQMAEQADREDRELTTPERHEWRMDVLRRAGRGMVQDRDHSWRPVALWLTKAIIASEQAAYFGPEDKDTPVLPGGELDYACRVGQAYLRVHGEGDPRFGMSDECPDYLADPKRPRRKKG